MAITATMTGHDLRIEREVINRGADSEGWAINEPGHHARTTCTCGLDTGWIAKADAGQAYQDHARQHCPHPETTDVSTFQDADPVRLCVACKALLDEEGNLVPCATGGIVSGKGLAAVGEDTPYCPPAAAIDTRRKPE